jgi:hAT family C-terminal dimerisation region
MTDLIELWRLLPTENPLVKLAIRLLSFVPSSASIERLFSLMGDTKTKKRNKMKTQKLQDITYVKSDLRQRQAKNGTAQRRLKRHFGNSTEPNGNRDGANRGQIEDEEIVRAAESGDMSDSESEDDEARGPAGDDGAREGQSFSRFVQAARGAAAADSDDEDAGEVVETNPSVGPTRNACYCLSRIQIHLLIVIYDRSEYFLARSIQLQSKTFSIGLWRLDGICFGMLGRGTIVRRHHSTS